MPKLILPGPAHVRRFWLGKPIACSLLYRKTTSYLCRKTQCRATNTYEANRLTMKNWKKVAKSPKIEISRISSCPISLESFDLSLLTSGLHLPSRICFKTFFGSQNDQFSWFFKKCQFYKGKFGFLDTKIWFSLSVADSSAQKSACLPTRYPLVPR